MATRIADKDTVEERDRSVTLTNKTISSASNTLSLTTSQVTDFNITSVSDNQILTYDNGTLKWINEALQMPYDIVIVASDDTTALTTGTGKASFRLPRAFTLTNVRGSLITPQASGSTLTIDVNLGGSSIFTTNLLTFDNTETTTATATTQPNITTTAMTDDGVITIDIDQIGTSGAAGLKINLIGYTTI